MKWSNYSSLYQIKYRKHILVIIIFLILIASLFISFKLQVFSSYKTYAIYLDNHLYVDIPIDNSDVLKKNRYVKIDNDKYKVKIDEISDLQVEGVLNYQTYALNIDKKFKDNEIVEITFYYNKQRMIKKIMDIIF